VKPRIVISAVNLIEGGTLSILHDCLTFASNQLTDRYEVIALVNLKSNFDYSKITFIDFPNAKRNWIFRLYYEYWGFRDISRKLKASLWLSLHDTTPSVSAQRQAVYCHNPAPFHNLLWRDIWFDPKFALFVLLYRWLYQINIRKNYFVIVQQNWLRIRFEKLFDIRNVLVAYPEVLTQSLISVQNKHDDIYKFIYPAFPRVFKNFEVLCNAAILLLDGGIKNFEILITIDGKENGYTKSIVKRYGKIRQIKFIGLQSRQKIFDLYKLVDCLVFPSRLETWGLPISEFKAFGKPIIAANLDYAKETVGSYHSAGFFDPYDAKGLANLLRAVIEASFVPSVNSLNLHKGDCILGWGKLFSMLLDDDF
jgi:glycosyltransferase involved in cell wall biosynthesis